MRTVARPAAIAAVAALVLTACGGDGRTTTPTTPPPVTTTSPATTASTPTSVLTPTGPPCPLSQSPEPGATGVSIRVAGGKVETPKRTVTVKTGSRVRLEVTADVVDEVHVHTYDERVETVAGCTVALTFTANIPGTHEVELERSHRVLVEIRAS